MKNIVQGLLFALVCATSSAWAVEPSRGTIKDGVYTFEAVGWTFVVPDGWRLRDKEEIARARGNGQKIANEALKIEAPPEDHSVLHLQSETGHARFTSDSVTDDTKDSADYEKTQQKVFDMLFAAFDALPLPRSEERGRVVIDGVTFSTQRIIFRAPNSDQIVMTGMNFDALLNGQSFSMGYTARTEQARAEIHDAIMKSKFKKR